ncbi:MAG: T9SS type A sorting domain-containing protein [Cytophagaceae bacterium]|nr:T9SS type A sorting domain-containing protein [Cytophagaceae bacterium]
MRKLLFSVVLASLIGAASAQSVTTFAGSGDVIVNGMSSDGQYVTGRVGTSMFVWTAVDGIAEWDAGATFYMNIGTEGNAVSTTGRIVGVSPNPAILSDYPYDDTDEQFPVHTPAYADFDTEGWMYLPTGNTQSLVFVYNGQAYAVSDDGKTIAGGGHIGSEADRKYAAWWDVTNPEAPVIHTLHADEFGRGSAVYSMSGDGSVMGGYIGTGLVYTPKLWIDGVETTLTGYSGGGRVYGVSNNGKYAVTSVGNKAGFYDIEAEQYTIIDATVNAIAFCVSNTGVVGGYLGTMPNQGDGMALPGNGAFLYRSGVGRVNLSDFLDQHEITYPEGFTFLSVTGITADGSKICGIGKTSDNQTVGFVTEIPAMTGEVYPVENITAVNDIFGTVEISWVAPSEAPETLTGFNVYCDDAIVHTAAATEISYTHTGLTEGTYIYKVTAVFGSDESPASKSVSVTMAQRSLPFRDGFVQPSLASTGWDVSSNTVPFSESWKLGRSGQPAPCAFFFPPQSGVYSESLTSPFFDATDVTDLLLRFNMTPSGINTPEDWMKIEIYDGTAWHELDNIIAWGSTFGFFAKEYDASVAAGKNGIRVRFTCYGSNGSNLNWNIDNVEVSDAENAFVPAPPTAIAAVLDREKDYVFVNWADASGIARFSYLFTSNWTASSTGNGGQPFIAASVYMPADLKLFEDYKLTTLSFMLSNNRTEPATYKWYVMQDGVRLCDEDIDTGNAGDNEWVTATLQNPIDIDVDKPLYYGVEVTTHGANDTPIATSDIFRVETDEGGKMLFISMDVAGGRGDIYSDDNGETWQTLDSIIDENSNPLYPLFCVRATVAKDPSASTPAGMWGYEVLRNGVPIFVQEYGDPRLAITSAATFIDSHPLPVGEEACYEVRSFYNNLLLSEPVMACVTVDPVIVASVTGEGTITPEGETVVPFGESQAFIFTPAAEYVLKKVFVNGTNVPAAVTAGSHTFTNVTANHTIVAKFEKESGIAGMGSTQLAAYPNPVVKGETLTVTVNSVSPNSMVSVYNVIGVLVKEVQSVGKTASIIMDMAPGMYVVQINGSKLKVVVK